MSKRHWSDHLRCVLGPIFPAGWMHAGYPIMGHLDSVKEMLDVKHMQTTGLWGPVHELGHNQQQQGWEFPPHTTEATCNLWSVYVHEKVLGIPRHQAHQALKSQCREERIREYLKKGAQLKDWKVWTALETYLQVTGKSRCISAVSEASVRRMPAAW